MGKIIGIDLGTTNSCVAVLEGEDAVVIPSADGARTTPSVVAFGKDGTRMVGAAAKRQMVTNAERTVTSIKREMGSDYRFKVDGRSYTPQELSAMILQKLKADAESYLGEKVTDAVITVPAYFSDAQRQATKDAGQIAGLNVKRIVNEPTAAALAYGVDKQEAQKIMVYDLGGGTFDVSVLDISQDVIQVLATSGNNRLGGDDFDQALVDYLVRQFKAEHKVDLTRDHAAMQRVREAAEKAKIELSGMATTSVNLPFLTQVKGEMKHLEASITRAKFDELTRDLVEATMGPVRQAMTDSGLATGELSKVLLVGGSTRIPAVQEAVKRFTGKDPFKGINPDECVAMGAAIQGGVLGGQVGSLLLLDVTPLTLGIETVGNMSTPVIERNTTLPVQRSQIFSTAANFQTSVDINVLQGERALASENKSLGKFRLSGIRRAMRGVPQIEVTFSIDANGIVTVSAKDLGTGHEQNITITGSTNMSKSDIERAVREAAMYADEDARRQKEAQAEGRAEELIYKAERLSKQLTKADQATLGEATARLKAAIKTKNNEEIMRASDELEHFIAPLERASDEQKANYHEEDGASDADYE